MPDTRSELMIDIDSELDRIANLVDPDQRIATLTRWRLGARTPDQARLTQLEVVAAHAQALLDAAWPPLDMGDEANWHLGELAEALAVLDEIATRAEHPAAVAS